VAAGGAGGVWEAAGRDGSTAATRMKNRRNDDMTAPSRAGWESVPALLSPEV
jgi:hypothetical protein